MSKKIKSKFAKDNNRRAYAILLPFFIWVFICFAFPLIFGFILGFMEWNGLNGAPKWVGIKNFATFFSSKDYVMSLGRQLWIGGLCLLINTIFSFIVALILNLPFKTRAFFRVSYYIPSISSVATTTAVFVALLNPYDGGINKFLKSIGKNPVIWTYSTFWMTFWIVVYFVWKSMGPAIILWLGGLQSISPSLYEAARIDGASKAQEIRYITIPGLKYITTFIMITGIISVMQMYDVVMFISRGGPSGSTDVLMYRIFRDGIQSFNMGMAGASSLVLGTCTIIFSLLYFKFFVKEEN